MRISEHDLATRTDVTTGVGDVDSPGSGWADRTRQVLTRELLARAARRGRVESQALRFRALHLNLPLVAEAADRLRLTDAERERCEHAALEGLHEAVLMYDPFGTSDFATFARPFLEWHVCTCLQAGVPRPTWRRRPGLVHRISRRTARPTRR